MVRAFFEAGREADFLVVMVLEEARLYFETAEEAGVWPLAREAADFILNGSWWGELSLVCCGWWLGVARSCCMETVSSLKKCKRLKRKFENKYAVARVNYNSIE